MPDETDERFIKLVEREKLVTTLIERIEALVHCSQGVPRSYHTLPTGEELWYHTFCYQGPIIEEPRLCNLLYQVIEDCTGTKDRQLKDCQLFWRLEDKVVLHSGMLRTRIAVHHPLRELTTTLEAVGVTHA